MTKYLMAVVVVAVAMAVLALSFPAEAQLQETTTTVIDSRLAPVIERDGKIKVLISLRDIDVIEAANGDFTKEMFSNVDWDLRARHAQEVQASVRAILGPEDATELSGFKTMPGLAATITASGLEKLRRHPDVIGIGAATLGSYSMVESAALIHAGAVHSAGYDGSGVNIAVLDTGIDTDHPDLVDSIVDEICFIQYTNCGPFGHPAEDVVGHGTNVSGVITSNGTVPGVPKGIAPEAGIYAYRVTTGSTPNANAVAASLEDLRLRNYPVDFVNMSFSLEGPLPGDCDTSLNAIELELAYTRLVAGVVPFAASGNQGDKGGMKFPACNPFVVAVGAVYDQAIGSKTWPGVCTDATTAPDLVACASNSSNSLDLLAPGCRITTTALGGGSDTVCGTSVSSPHAVGVAALLKDAQPSLTADQIELRMKATGKWVFDAAAFRWTPRIDARVALLTDDNADWDGDGCRNGTEYGSDYTLGGQRNPLDPWDYYDVSIPKDGVMDLPNDILGVLNHISPDGSPPYDVYYDRGPAIGKYFYSHSPPDGVIDLANDLLSVINQFNPGVVSGSYKRLAPEPAPASSSAQRFLHATGKRTLTSNPSLGALRKGDWWPQRGTIPCFRLERPAS